MTRETAAATTAGEVQLDGDTATLLFRRELAHPPEAVWAALTEPEQLRQWYMSEAKIDGRPGGSVQLVSGPARFEVSGKILAWDPPRRLEYEWNVEPRKELPTGERSVLRYELSPTGSGGTILVLTHRKLTRNTALGFAPGSHAFLDRLQAHLDHSALPDWQRRYDEVKGHYPQWTPNF